MSQRRSAPLFLCAIKFLASGSVILFLFSTNRMLRHLPPVRLLLWLLPLDRLLLSDLPLATAPGTAPATATLPDTSESVTLIDYCRHQKFEQVYSWSLC